MAGCFAFSRQLPFTQNAFHLRQAHANAQLIELVFAHRWGRHRVGDGVLDLRWWCLALFVQQAVEAIHDAANHHDGENHIAKAAGALAIGGLGGLAHAEATSASALATPGVR